MGNLIPLTVANIGCIWKLLEYGREKKYMTVQPEERSNRENLDEIVAKRLSREKNRQILIGMVNESCAFMNQERNSQKLFDETNKDGITKSNDDSLRGKRGQNEDTPKETVLPKISGVDSDLAENANHKPTSEKVLRGANKILENEEICAGAIDSHGNSNAGENSDILTMCQCTKKHEPPKLSSNTQRTAADDVSTSNFAIVTTSFAVDPMQRNLSQQLCSADFWEDESVAFTGRMKISSDKKDESFSEEMNIILPILLISITYVIFGGVSTKLFLTAEFLNESNGQEKKTKFPFDLNEHFLDCQLIRQLFILLTRKTLSGSVPESFWWSTKMFLLSYLLTRHDFSMSPNNHKLQQSFN